MPSVVWRAHSGALVDSVYRTPGYPAIVWLVGGAAWLAWVIVLQCVLGGVVNVALTERLGRRLAGPRAAIVAAWIVALDPASIGHSLLVATETVATTGLLIATLLVHRLWTSLRASVPARTVAFEASQAGLVLGLLALIRPSMAVLLLPIAVGLAAARRSRAAVVVVAIVVGVALVPIGGWFIRNETVARTGTLARVDGQNLLDYGQAAEIVDLHGVSILDRPGVVQIRAISALPRGDASPVAPDQVDRDPARTNRIWRRTGLRLLRQHPAGAVLVAGHSLVRTVVAPGTNLFRGQFSSADWKTARPVIDIVAGAWIGLFDVVVAWAVVRSIRRRRWELLAFTAGLAALVLAGQSGAELYLRFRVPVVPSLAILAGWLVVDVSWGRAGGRRGSSPRRDPMPP